MFQQMWQSNKSTNFPILLIIEQVLTLPASLRLMIEKKNTLHQMKVGIDSFE